MDFFMNNILNIVCFLPAFGDDRDYVFAAE